MTKDVLITCPKCNAPESCYKLPINEVADSYNCLSCGFITNDLLKEGEYDIEAYEAEMPELFKDIKHIDDEKRAWYPHVINIEHKGTVFPNGSSKDSWQWSAIKSVRITEEEEKNSRFKGKKYKSDSKTLTEFGKDYFAACDYIGFFDLE